MADLNECRRKIDAIDRAIAELFLQRMEVVKTVAESKKSTGKPVYDPVREEEKLKKAESFADTESEKKALREFFADMMSLSRNYQYRLLNDVSETIYRENLPPPENIGFYGGRGTYTELAMKDFFGASAEGTAYFGFRELCKALFEKKISYAVLPAENSATGSISDTYELLSEYGLHILAEKTVRIDHALLGLPDAELSDITDIYTHAEPILQCDAFLSSLKGIRAHAFGSTAESAAKVKRDGLLSAAAIASRRNSSFYGLKVLRENISDDPNNATRFFLIGKEDEVLRGANRISIRFDLPHRSGSLYDLLSHFIYNNVNLTSIRSHPILGERRTYRFFIEMDGSLRDENILTALSGVRAESASFSILGNFRADRESSF